MAGGRFEALTIGGINRLNELFADIYSKLDGGGGGTSISLGIEGAEVGQVATVGSVDTDGRPTSWEAYSASIGTIGYVVTEGDLVVTLDGSSDAVNYLVTNGDLGITVTVTLG